MTETSFATSPVAAAVTVSMPHDCTVTQSSATEGGGGHQASVSVLTAVVDTFVVPLCTASQILKGNVDSSRMLMPRRLDYRLSQVAALRQISIKTARDWRDSENKKWATAISEIEDLRRDQRIKTRQGKTVLPTLDAIRNLPSNSYEKAVYPLGQSKDGN